PPPSLSTLSLHDALPIFGRLRRRGLGGLLARFLAPDPLATRVEVDAVVHLHGLLVGPVIARVPGAGAGDPELDLPPPGRLPGRRDRKSTRLNSSHVKISY